MRKPYQSCWFSCASSCLVELELEIVGFSGGRKTGEPGELTLGKRAKETRVNNQLNSIEPTPHW